MSRLSDISRYAFTQAILTLDFCARAFGEGACLATGEPCYNTFPTCKYPAAYSRTTKDYDFCSADAPIPFPGPRPYLKSTVFLPTEIKDNLTINARVIMEFYDEPDGDVGIDPYLSQRASVQGTFWKKLLARNPNYKNRLVKIYCGVLSTGIADWGKFPWGEFPWGDGERWQDFVGIIDKISLERGIVRVECADLLKALDKIDIPEKVDIKLLVDIDASTGTVGLNDTTGLDDAPNYARIGDEIVYYAAINPTTNQLTGCTRGAFDTVASTHTAKDKLSKARYYPPANGFDILKEMLLTDAAIDPGYVDTDAFDACQIDPGGEVDFTAIIVEPTQLDKLYFEIVNLLDCKSWVGEDLKITIARNLPSQPGRTYSYFSDAENIIVGSPSVDLNPESRLSRVVLYWDKSTLGDVDKEDSYSCLDIALDATAESANEYGEVAEEKIFCRWLRQGYETEEVMSQFIKDFTARRVRARRDPMPIINIDVDLKDVLVKTGAFARLSTDEVLGVDGFPIVNSPFLVVKREFKGTRATLRLLKIRSGRIGFIGPDDLPIYSEATSEQKEYGFICDDLGMIDGDEGYVIW